jgi:hypothetical protein
MLQSTTSFACSVAWGSPVGPIALCMMSGEVGGCIINLRAAVTLGLESMGEVNVFSSWGGLVWTGLSQVVPL